MAKSKAELLAELKALKSARRAESWASVVNNIVRWAGVVLIAHYAYLAVDALAGKHTLTEMTFLGDVQVSVFLAWAAGLAGAGYGWRQRKLRKDTVERLQRRVIELETSVDPKRSSSNLTQRGDSRPEDVP